MTLTRSFVSFAAGAFVAGSLFACGGGGGGSSAPPPMASFSVPGGPNPPVDFYDLPFPNDLRMANGHVDMSAYPAPPGILTDYMTAISANLDGFGLNAAIVTRFADPIDPTTLPQTQADSLADGASVYLVDIDPASPDLGQKWPLVYRFEPRKGQSIGTNWLSALPYPGFPLDEGTTYALIVTDRLHSADGQALTAPPDFDAIRATTAPTNAALAAAQTTYAKLWTYLNQAGGDAREDVVTAAVFTTQRATAIMPLLRKRVWTMPQPAPTTLARTTVTATYIQYDGTFPGPNFQAGDAPYGGDGGQIEMDTDGLPKVQHTENLRVAMSVPVGTKPAAGWPLVMYAHGTGGNYHDFLDDGTAGRMAALGLAVISMDEVLNGPRDPDNNPDFDFFNFMNPQAARFNTVQGGADKFSLLRLAQGIDYKDPGTSPSGVEITFDPARYYFFGHSQGSLTGPPFLSAEPLIKGAVLSGAGAVLYLSLLTKTMPYDVASIVKTLVRDPGLDENDPTLAVMQMWIEDSDPANYGPLLARHPGIDPTGDGTKAMAAKAIYQSEGFIDTYAPDPTIEAFATTIGGNQVGPTQSTVPGLVLRGQSVLTAPVMNNLDGTTVVLLQYVAAPNDDGHFVVFDVPAAETQSTQFLGTLASTGTATLVGVQ